MNEIVKISNLSVAYGNEPPVLQNVELTVFQNDFLGIIGPNGGGKTTLLKTLLGLLPASTGTIEFYQQGKRVNRLNIGYLPQINRIDKKFPISVLDVILSGLTVEKKIFSNFTAQQKEQAIRTAEKMGLGGLLKRPVGDLSGGQLQRTLLGRAIVDEPDLLALDEPDSYVDKQFETDFYDILTELNTHTAIILVSHDVGTILSQVKNVACVNGGLHYHPAEGITPEWIDKRYASCPIEFVAHGDFPHRVLGKHEAG
ncbi:MAG: ATP-binding cassette domain-containing protein [Prevotella sp.]|jgi:zinc transport system ATP-binding protein|nr:ATP-binding cassette domain-containing protein [Prevotella sp.]